MIGKFKLKGINYEVVLTDEVRSVGNYRIEKTNSATKITISGNISNREFMSISSKLSRYLLTIGDLTGKELQNFEDELLDIWMFKNFRYTTE